MKRTISDSTQFIRTACAVLLAGLLSFSSIICAGQTLPQAESRENASRVVTILTFNIRNGRCLSGSEVKLDVPAAVIRDVKPDVAGIQELDFNTKRSGQRDIPAELGKLTQMTAYFASAIDFDGGNYGIGVLSRLPARVRSVPLPGEEERRVLQIAEFDDFVLFNTHFSLTPQSRLESIPEIERERQKLMNQKDFTKPIFLCGDFNALPDSETIRELQKTWKILTPDASTFPADAPNIRIDYVMTPIGTPVQVLEAFVVPALQASDHRPVCVKALIPCNEKKSE